MSEQRQTVKVSVDIGELVDSLSWDVMRKDIDPDGAKGVGDGYGVITLRLNGQASVIVRIHEDELGQVVVDMHDGRNRAGLARVPAEEFGHVPPRTGAKARKERRFGDEPLGS